MKLAAYVFLGLLALAVLGAIAKVAGLIILAVVILAFAFRPRQAFGFVLGMMFLGLLGRYPLPMIALSTALVVFAITEKPAL